MRMHRGIVMTLLLLVALSLAVAMAQSRPDATTARSRPAERGVRARTRPHLQIHELLERQPDPIHHHLLA